MNTLYYLRDKALQTALLLHADARLLRDELGRSYGSLMTAADLKAIARQRTECAALMDTCLDFSRYIGTPEAWVEAKQSGGYDLVAEANKMLSAMGPGGKA